VATSDSLLCSTVGPRTKYQLKVTAAVMSMSPSKRMRVRATADSGRLGRVRMPSRMKGEAPRKPTSAQEGNGVIWCSTSS
jgi:hypothetical protein